MIYYFNSKHVLHTLGWHKITQKPKKERKKKRKTTVIPVQWKPACKNLHFFGSLAEKVPVFWGGFGNFKQSRFLIWFFNISMMEI